MSEGEPTQINQLNFLRQFKDSPSAVPHFLKHTNDQAKDTNIVHFERHFNKDLSEDSYYFKSLSDFMSCVEKNADKNLTAAQQDRVCAKEFKKLRLQAFDNQLFYHNVNKRQFHHELALFKHEAPY